MKGDESRVWEHGLGLWTVCTETARLLLTQSVKSSVMYLIWYETCHALQRFLPLGMGEVLKAQFCFPGKL